MSGPLDAGQIAVGCALGFLDIRHAEREAMKATRPYQTLVFGPCQKGPGLPVVGAAPIRQWIERQLCAES